MVADYGCQARLLAGGTDLIVNMRCGRDRPSVVVDTKRVAELNQIKLSRTRLVVGASVSCRRIWEQPEITQRFPALIDSVTLIGGIPIQSRASVGGNLCNAAPSGDAIPSLIALRATAQICGPNDLREVPVEDFCSGAGENTLAKDEFLVSLTIPQPAQNSSTSFLRFTPRNEMDIAVVNAAANVTLSETKTTFLSARLAVGSVAPAPLFVEEAGKSLIGKSVCTANVVAAAEIAVAHARPIDDMRGTFSQRKQLTKVLTIRTLLKAIKRAGGTIDDV